MKIDKSESKRISIWKREQQKTKEFLMMLSEIESRRDSEKKQKGR